MLNDETGQTNNLTDKHIMGISKMNHIQRYMTSFELEYRQFERKPQIHQLNHTFPFF